MLSDKRSGLAVGELVWSVIAGREGGKGMRNDEL